MCQSHDCSRLLHPPRRARGWEGCPHVQSPVSIQCKYGSHPPKRARRVYSGSVGCLSPPHENTFCSFFISGLTDAMTAWQDCIDGATFVARCRPGSCGMMEEEK